MHQIIAPDHFGIRIGKNRERVALTLGKIARLFRTVDADRDRADPRFSQPVPTFFNAPQLGVA